MSSPVQQASSSYVELGGTRTPLQHQTPSSSTSSFSPPTKYIPNGPQGSPDSDSSSSLSPLTKYIPNGPQSSPESDSSSSLSPPTKYIPNGLQYSPSSSSGDDQLHSVDLNQGAKSLEGKVSSVGLDSPCLPKVTKAVAQTLGTPPSSPNVSFSPGTLSPATPYSPPEPVFCAPVNEGESDRNWNMRASKVAQLIGDELWASRSQSSSGDVFAWSLNKHLKRFAFIGNPAVLTSAYIYLKRLKEQGVVNRKLEDGTVGPVPFRITMANIDDLMMTSLCVAKKMLDDRGFKNSAFVDAADGFQYEKERLKALEKLDAAGVSQIEKERLKAIGKLNGLEREFMKDLDYNLAITADEFDRCTREIAMVRVDAEEAPGAASAWF